MKNQNISICVDIWCNIVQHLEPRDALNAAATCQTWYLDLSNQAIWEVVCKNCLPGYPEEHFVVPDAIKKIKRHDFVFLNSRNTRTLHDWTQSWKQRVVYLAHIMNIQWSAVEALNTRTYVFLEEPEPLHDIDRVNLLEGILGKPLPIDFVIFMTYYAQHLVFGDVDQYHDYATLASGYQFENEDIWLNFIEEEFTFEDFDQDGLSNQTTKLDGIQEFYGQMVAIPFSQPHLRQFDRLSYSLFLMLSSNTDYQPDMANEMNDEDYVKDMASMVNGVGKVFFAHREFECWISITYVSESFTDYLIQYTGTVLEYGELPTAAKGEDLAIPLQRKFAPRQSILLPQPPDWDIGQYLPSNFTFDNFRWDGGTRIKVWSTIEESKPLCPVVSFDNPDCIRLTRPPKDMFEGFKCAHWTPYYELKAAAEQASKMKTLSDFGRGGAPNATPMPINRAIYDILQLSVNQWMEICPSTIGTPKDFSQQELLRIRELSQALEETEFYQFFRIGLPILLYYETYLTSERCLWFYKLFQDHLDGLKNNNPKYSAEELLSVLYPRFKYCSDAMIVVISRVDNTPIDHPCIEKIRHGENILPILNI